MTIMHSEQANETSLHLLVQNHPESNKEAVYSCVGYIVGNDDIEKATSEDLLSGFYQWQKDMLVMWDNSLVLHHAAIGSME